MAQLKVIVLENVMFAVYLSIGFTYLFFESGGKWGVGGDYGLLKIIFLFQAQPNLRAVGKHMTKHKLLSLTSLLRGPSL